MSNLMLKLSQAFSKWAAPPGGSQKKHPYDHIETYLSDQVMTVESIKTYGGYLAYWEVARCQGFLYFSIFILHFSLLYLCRYLICPLSLIIF